MCIYITLILLRKVQNEGKYWKITWILLKIEWKQYMYIAIYQYCNTVKNITIYRNMFLLYHDTHSGEAV